MAMAGFSLVEDNETVLPEQELVYDWLSARGIQWRVYHEGIPFFALMPKWLGRFGSNNFRRLVRLPKDIQEEGDSFPQVIFIEPTYTDAHLGQPNDDHPPTSITRGQELLRKVYRALTSNLARWQKTVLIVTYDEHGGFFDHVPPLPIRCDPPPGATYRPFDSTGVRVPALVVSPLVSPRRVFKQPMDHTSILRFIAETFGDGSYSDVVDARQANGLSSVTDVLDLPAPRTDVPHPPLAVPFLPTFNENTAAFKEAMKQMRRMYPDEAEDHFPELWHSEET